MFSFLGAMIHARVKITQKQHLDLLVQTQIWNKFFIDQDYSQAKSSMNDRGVTDEEAYKTPQERIKR